MDTTTIETRIRETRIKHGWSQSELARRMKSAGEDWHQTVVSKVEASSMHHQTGIARSEAGTRDLRVSEAITLSKVLGVDLMWLLVGGVSNDRYAEGYVDGCNYVFHEIDELKKGVNS